MVLQCSGNTSLFLGKTLNTKALKCILSTHSNNWKGNVSCRLEIPWAVNQNTQFEAATLKPWMVHSTAVRTLGIKSLLECDFSFSCHYLPALI